MYLECVIGAAAILCALYLWVTKDHGYWKKRGIPYVKPRPVVGNMGRMVLGTRSFGEIFAEIYHDYKGFPYVGIFNMGQPTILIRDLDIIRNVLIADFNMFHDNSIEVDEAADPILAKNPFFLTGDRWKIIRGQLSPQLTSAKMKAMFPLVQAVCKNLVKHLDNDPETTSKDGIETKGLALKFTTDNVASCAFGLEANSFDDPDAEFKKMIEALVAPGFWANLKLSLFFAFPALLSWFSVSIADPVISDKFRKIVTETVEYRQKNKIVRNDFLDSICELKSKPLPFDYTTDYMVAHCFSFFLDGSETSAVALSYALFELAINPDIQAKLEREIDEVVRKNGGNVTFEAIQEMKYLDAVFHETLRKYPPSMAMTRKCTSEYKFPPVDNSAGAKELVVEKGTAIAISIYALHRDSQYYPDPERFDPDRFTEHARVPLPKNCFFGFGEGPRICLGQKFATMQVKAGIVAVLQNFELRVTNKTQIPLEIVHEGFLLGAKGGLWLNFYRRKSAS